MAFIVLPQPILLGVRYDKVKQIKCIESLETSIRLIGSELSTNQYILNAVRAS